MSGPVRLPGIEVSPPPVTPYRYGLFSAAEPRPDASRRWEIAGVSYQTICDRGGGVWLDPCFVSPLPDPVATSAFVVTLDRAAVTDAPIIATLTSRNAGWGTLPVTVVVDGVTKTLATVGATQTWAITAGSTVDVSASIPRADERHPDASAEDEFVVPADDTGETVVLTGTADVDPEYPTKTLPLGLDLVEGFPFIVYESAACGVGFSEAEARTHATERLLRHEQYWVEQRFAATVLNTADTTELNGGTALPLAQALGLLEQELADRYGGVGVLHARRNVAAVLAAYGKNLERDGDKLLSILDNVWSFGAGYPHVDPGGGTAPTASQAWIYATGPVDIRRSEPQIRTDFSSTRNIRMALAERAYVITADCPRLAVLATLPGSP